MKTETIELIGGYTDKDGKTHKTVTFGKRLTAKDLMNVDTNPQARIETQYQDLIRRQMITKFGTLKMPVGLNALSSLNSIDRDDLESAADRFLANSREGREGEFREINLIKLMFGFEIGETFYDVVEFGNQLIGLDEIEADVKGLRGVARDCFMVGRQISKLSTDDGTAASITGKVDLDKFDSLDAEDLSLLKVGGELYRQSFRLKRESVSGKPDSESGDNSDKGVTNDDKRSVESAN